MRILNRNKGTVLAENATRAASFFSRLVGLLPRRGLAQGEGLILDPSNSIHSLFMRFTFDAVFLDRDGKVVAVMPSFKPFRVSPLFLNSKLTLELPEGTIGASSTTVGDTILIAQ